MKELKAGFDGMARHVGGWPVAIAKVVYEVVFTVLTLWVVGLITSNAIVGFCLFIVVWPFAMYLSGLMALFVGKVTIGQTEKLVEAGLDACEEAEKE